MKRIMLHAGHRRHHSGIPFMLALLTVPVSTAQDVKPDPKSIEFFEKQVRPLIVSRCLSCHGPEQQFSSLRMDSREALLRGGNRGPAIVPGDARLSLLAKAIRHDGLKMPAGGKLADARPAHRHRGAHRGRDRLRARTVATDRPLDGGSAAQDRLAMIILRLAYTAIVMVIVVWLLRAGNPVGGLVVIPALAVWLRRDAESGRLAARVRRAIHQ